MNRVCNKEQLTVEIYDVINEVKFEIETMGIVDIVDVLYDAYEEKFEVSVYCQNGDYLGAIYNDEAEVIEALSERYFS